jgi:DNA-directed RNA polymerase subunit alpha
MSDEYTSKNWNSMIRPLALECDSDTLTKSYGKFVAKPLERGYGQTLGNSLRRVLLSSLQGAGIVAIRIEGVDHEFGTINNVKEEVSEIILNLKEVYFALNTKEDVTLTLEKVGEGPVRAGDIMENSAVRVLNPDHIIANISSGGSIRMELKVARGKGYVTAADNKEVFELPIGWIHLDTLFSPVHRVNYTVTASRVGKRTDYDRLTLEVWTNSGLSPQDAVAYSAKVLRDQMIVFMNFEDEEQVVRKETQPIKAVSSTNSALLSQYLNLNFLFVQQTVYKMQTSSTSMNWFRKRKARCYVQRTLAVNL